LHSEAGKRRVLGDKRHIPPFRTLSRHELETALHISGAGINWHMHRLSGGGILTVRQDGRNARYELNPDVFPSLEKYLDDADPVQDPDTRE